MELRGLEKRLQEVNGVQFSAANEVTDFSGHCVKLAVVIMQTSPNITMALTINLM